MKDYFGKEELRQFVHIGLGCLLVILLEINLITDIGEEIPISFLNPEARVLLFVVIFGVSLSIVCRENKVPVISFILRKVEREEVRENAPGEGAVYGAIGSFIVLSLFDLDIAKASILILSFGDSVSNLIGTNFGLTKNPLNANKSIEGTLGGFFFAFFGVIIYFGVIESAIASFVGMFFECIEKPIDDNLVVPIASATVLYLL